jgi:hypothetical protein
MKISVFYSWQSDSPNPTNRGFIEKALEQAIQQVKSDDTIGLEIAPDRDTKDVPGTPPITQTILEKIDRCGLFLCDVTIITSKRAKRPTPNPNVLVELGYAVARVGWERIVFVMNTYFGTVAKLPFDLKGHRYPITYSLEPDATAEERARVRQKLSKDIASALKIAIDSRVIVNAINPKDRRVAQNFESILNNNTGTFWAYLQASGFAAGLTIVNKGHDDEVGAEYPSPKLVDPIVEVLSRYSFRTASNMSVDGKTLNWAGAFLRDFHSLARECKEILEHYADRDNRLISLVEDIRNRSEALILAIDASFTQPQLAHLYTDAKGVPDVHLDGFRYFLLAVMKARRVIRDFLIP